MAPFPPNLDDGERWIPSSILDSPVPRGFLPSLGGSGLPLGARRSSASVLPYGSRPRPPPPSRLVPQQRFQPPINVRSWNGLGPISPVPPSRPVIPYRAVPPQVMMSGHPRPRRPLVVPNGNFRSSGTGVFIPQVVADGNRRMNQGTLRDVQPIDTNNIWRNQRMESEARALVWEREEASLEDVLPSEWTY